MKNCLQTENQTIYQHGVSVKNHTFKLINLLNINQLDSNYRLPDWFLYYRNEILQSLFPLFIIEKYTIFHDCGKPYCLTYDSSGKKHFPQHSEKSYYTWLDHGGDDKTAQLIKMDMLIHTIKTNDIDNFIKNPEAITLLIVGLAEIHANAELFGGIESVSFKIKWKQINKKGKDICNKLFRSMYVVD